MWRNNWCSRMCVLFSGSVFLSVYLDELCPRYLPKVLQLQPMDVVESFPGGISLSLKVEMSIWWQWSLPRRRSYMLFPVLCWVRTLVSPRASCGFSQTNPCVVEVGLRTKWEKSLRLNFVSQKEGSDEGETGFKKHHSNKCKSFGKHWIF